MVSKDRSIFPLEKFQKEVLSRATLRNFAFDGNIINYPLYGVGLFPILSLVKKVKNDL